MKKYIFKPFQTRGGYYIYDRSVDTFFRVSKDEFVDFQEIENGKCDPDTSQTFLKYQSAGYLYENCVRCIEHPDLKLIKYYADRHMQYMTLQITQNCNLRCEYCIYSGAYDHQRTHSSKRMSWDTAKKAIDYFLLHSIDTPQIAFGFYGGEPLLEFDLIKECVQYIQEHVQSKYVEYNITTNGTLLTEDVFEFLSEHGFNILISLDGNKEEHNRHRKFASNGEGSFDVIMDNIRRLREKYPKEALKIEFNAVMTPESDLSCMMDFFEVDEILSDHQVMFNDVTPGLDTDLDDEDRFWTVRHYEYLKYFLALTGHIDIEHTSSMARRAFTTMVLLREQMRKHNILTPCSHHNGPCIPGVSRLLVSVDGTFFPCQNVSEIKEYFKIGSIDEGLDVERMSRLLNNGELTAEDCKDCWKLRMCSICSQSIEFEGDVITRNDKLVQCAFQEDTLLKYLKQIATLSEFGYDPEAREGREL